MPGRENDGHIVGNTRKRFGRLIENAQRFKGLAHGRKDFRRHARFPQKGFVKRPVCEKSARGGDGRLRCGSTRQKIAEQLRHKQEISYLCPVKMFLFARKKLIRCVKIVDRDARNVKQLPVLVRVFAAHFRVGGVAVMARIFQELSVLSDQAEIHAPRIYPDAVYPSAGLVRKAHRPADLRINFRSVPDEVAALLLGAVGKAVHHLFAQAVSVKGVNDPAPRACAEVDGKNVVCLHLSHQPLNTASISSTSFWLIGLIFATEFAKSTERAE